MKIILETPDDCPLRDTLAQERRVCGVLGEKGVGQQICESYDGYYPATCPLLDGEVLVVRKKYPERVKK